MQEINTLEIIAEEMTRSRHPAARRNTTFYPSSASAVLADGRVIGGCWRSDWYRIHNITPTNTSGFYMHMIWALGHAVEAAMVEQMKRAGIYEANSVKFLDRVHNVSGELDIVGRYRADGGIRYYGVEIKSVYGIGGTMTITGRRRAWRGQAAFAPKPKESNLMQVMKYLVEFDPEGEDRYALDFFKLIYCPRDKPNAGREYTVTLVKKEDLDAGLLAEFGEAMVAGERYALISTEGFPTRIETGWSLENMHRRWLQQKEYFATGVIPPRPFKKFYPKDEMEGLYNSGAISKTAYEKWVKGTRDSGPKPMTSIEITPGHFLCKSYCDWRDFCYTADGRPRPEADRVGLVQIAEPQESSDARSEEVTSETNTSEEGISAEGV